MIIAECTVEYALAPRDNQPAAFTNRLQQARLALLWNGQKKLCLAISASGSAAISMHLVEDNTVSVEEVQIALVESRERGMIAFVLGADPSSSFGPSQPLRFRIFCEMADAQKLSGILKGLRDRVPVEKIPGIDASKLAGGPDFDVKSAPLLRRAVHPTGAPPAYPGMASPHKPPGASPMAFAPAMGAAFAAAQPMPGGGPAVPSGGGVPAAAAPAPPSPSFHPPPPTFYAAGGSAPYPSVLHQSAEDHGQKDEEAAERESRLEHEILELQSILDQSQERLTAEERAKAAALTALRKAEEERAKSEEDKRQLEERVRNLTAETSRLQSDLANMRLKSTPADRAPRPASDIYTYLMELDPSALAVDDKQRLGEGSFGIVYRALYNATPVAVKKLRIGLIEQKRDEFEAELMTLMLLRHPNIVLMITACFSDKWRGQECIVCELMEGGNLYDILHVRKVVLSAAQKRSIMIGIGRGLAYLHGLRPQLIHRDLTPANILLDQSLAVPKLSDFGLSRWRAEMSVAKTQAGTLRWMAPEIFREEGYEASADIYSFGLVLWEIFTGILPFAEVSEAALPIQVGVKHLRPKGDSLPDRLRALVERCWGDDPKRRPSAVEATAELESGAADPVRPPPSPTPSVV